MGKDSLTAQETAGKFVLIGIFGGGGGQGTEWIAFDFTMKKNEVERKRWRETGIILSDEEIHST